MVQKRCEIYYHPFTLALENKNLFTWLPTKSLEISREMSYFCMYEIRIKQDWNVEQIASSSPNCQATLSYLVLLLFSGVVPLVLQFAFDAEDVESANPLMWPTMSSLLGVRVLMSSTRRSLRVRLDLILAGSDLLMLFIEPCSPAVSDRLIICSAFKVAQTFSWTHIAKIQTYIHCM